MRRWDLAHGASGCGIECQSVVSVLMFSVPDVCQVLRANHHCNEEFIGPRFWVYTAGLRFTLWIGRIACEISGTSFGIGYHITKCCTKVCPEGVRSRTTLISPPPPLNDG